MSKTAGQWPAAKKWIEEQIADRLEKLADEKCGIKESDFLRGEIRAFRFIIADMEPKPKAEPVAVEMLDPTVGY